MMPLLFAIIKSTKGNFQSAHKLIQEGKVINDRVHKFPTIPSDYTVNPVDLSTSSKHFKAEGSNQNLVKTKIFKPWNLESHKSFKQKTSETAPPLSVNMGDMIRLSTMA